ncbi:hypothetical protein NHX12_013994 [Muraenolepis orangiensis]|uniref:Uncharacterized protein n=1 Tax=Muraenolepis orangiensis TaxID=630683 RepID=A0A9Q0DCW6_9TELE|nr:hypothetical protein NHX12_013994 [Muraenolepis orangiensis]
MIDCGGLEMSWVVRPPEEVKSGQVFSVTYTVSAHDTFYDWAIKKDIFPHSWNDANGENCCIHHANIHSCPIGYLTTERICGPWIPDDGNIFTHTISTAGTMAQLNWTSKVVLVHAGLTSLIAHIRVGRMQVALEAKSTVLPPLADCEECPLTLGIKLAVGLPVSLVCLCFTLTAVWFMYQKRKLLWDESWIIDFTLIKRQDHARTTMGSMMSVPVGTSDSNTSCVTGLSSCTTRKNTFTCTAIYDGRTVAIKRIQTKSFSLSKTRAGPP